MKLLPLFGSLACVTIAATSYAANPVTPGKPVMARLCTTCHTAEPGVLFGNFDNVAFKANTIQLKIDERTELLKFDEDDIKVTSSERKNGDGGLLKKTKNGHEVKVFYTESNGTKTATRFVEKPPAKIPNDMLISTAELEKLVSLGPAKGKYFLYDVRPAIGYQEGAIPTAGNIPFSAFDMMVENLPRNKNALIIYYDAGPDCYMSSDSAKKAQKLGYTNVRVYRDGASGWSEQHFSTLSPAFLSDAWQDKGIPYVLLDVRPAATAAKGHIRGAVSFPAAQAARKLRNLPPKEKNPPVIIYDAKGGADAEKVAGQIVKAGYSRVIILAGGFEGWRAAKYETVTGKPAAVATYTPRPRTGEIAVDVFKQYAAALPADVMIIDVRNKNEVKSGKLKNAINIPEEELREKMDSIPKDKLIVTYCASGVRAEMAYHSLKDLGYSKVGFLNAKISFEPDGGFTISKD